MLSSRHRFLFVHIPKTAGNAIQDALRAYADDEIVCLAPHQDGVERFELRSHRYRTVKHSTVNDYRREYGADVFDGLYRFTCVRNPWDRCMSYYFSPHRGEVHWQKSDFVDFVEREVRPVAHFLSLGSVRQPLVDAVRNVHQVLRFEHLDADFAHFCRQVGLPVLPVSRRNASRRDDPAAHFDADTVALVARLFAEEIDHFGHRSPLLRQA